MQLGRLSRRFAAWGLRSTRGFESRENYALYRCDVRASAMRRPADAHVCSNLAKAAPFLSSVDPNAAHLRLWRTSREREAPDESSAAFSFLEAEWPLSTDAQLRMAVADLGSWSTFRLSKFYEAVDALTADVAYKHTDGYSRNLTLVTAAHAHSWKDAKTVLTRDVSLRCYVTRAGSASLELRTDAVQLDDDGNEVLLNTCATTMVALDSETMKPAKGSVPSISVADDDDLDRSLLRAEVAETHVIVQKARAASLLQLRAPMSRPPEPHEVLAVHELTRRVQLAAEGSGESLHAKTVQRCTFRSSCIVFPEQRNVHGKLFGGFIVGQAYNLAFYAMRFFADGQAVVPLGMDEATFAAAVAVGDCVTFTARVVHCTGHTARVNVAVEVRDPAHASQAPTKPSRLVFVFATDLKDPGVVVPETYREMLMHIDASRASAVRGPDDADAARFAKSQAEPLPLQ